MVGRITVVRTLVSSSPCPWALSHTASGSTGCMVTRHATVLRTGTLLQHSLCLMNAPSHADGILPADLSMVEITRDFKTNCMQGAGVGFRHLPARQSQAASSTVHESVDVHDLARCAQAVLGGQAAQHPTAPTLAHVHQEIELQLKAGAASNSALLRRPASHVFLD